MDEHSLSDNMLPKNVVIPLEHVAPCFKKITKKAARIHQPTGTIEISKTLKLSK